MKFRRTICIFSFIALYCLVMGLQAQETRVAEKVYKNVRVLKGLTPDQFNDTMSFMSASLGVKCSHCHAGEKFDTDEKAAKAVARDMIELTYRLNALSFGGKQAVTCYTCHRGQLHPSSAPPVLFGYVKESSPVALLPTPDEVLNRYTQALGGEAALSKISTRLRKGRFQNSRGGDCPLELYEKLPGKYLSVMVGYRRPGVSVYRGIRDNEGWTMDDRGVQALSLQDTARERRDWAFLGTPRLKEIYDRLTVKAREKLGGREVFRVEGEISGFPAEQLFFDANNGLLLRRVVFLNNPLGPYPEETDFDDYREVDGVKLPFLVTRARSDYRAIRKIEEVAHNISIPDEKLNPVPVAARSK